MSAPAPLLELVTLVGFHYVGLSDLRPPDHRACNPGLICSVLSWARQAARLATRLSVATGRATSVHLFTRCLPEDAGPLFERITTRASTHVVIHASHEQRLLDALVRISKLARRRRRQGSPPQWHGGFLLNLLRWTCVRSTWAELAISIDLDTDMFPLLRSAPAKWQASHLEHWVSLLRCVAKQTRYSLFSLYDGSAPVNTAFLVIRPNATLYEEGLHVLARAASYNRTHGWDAVGRPSTAIPASDHVWVSTRTKAMEMVAVDSWRFASAETDQGFFLYMFRIRHALGADLRVLPSCRRRVIHARKQGAGLGHYAGGIKPEHLLASPPCVSSSWPSYLKQQCPGCQRNTSDRPERNAWEIARSVAWGQRTIIELGRLGTSLARANHQSGSAAEAKLGVPQCRDFLQSALACASRGLAQWRVGVTERLRRRMQKRCRIERCPYAADNATSISAADFLALQYPTLDDARPRAPMIS